MTKLKIIVAMDADKAAETSADLRILTHSERFLAGLRAAGICWGLAVISVFLPVVHFVLVPGFLVGGVLGFFIQFKKTEFLVKTHVTCPKCQKDFDLKQLSFNWPLRQNCPSCQMVLLIKKN